MGRTAGSLIFSNSYEVKYAGPLDARLTVPKKADLTSAVTTLTDPSLGIGSFSYVGMIVSVTNDGINNGVYLLTAPERTSEANWVKLGTGTGSGTVISVGVVSGGGLKTSITGNAAITTSGDLSVDTDVIATKTYVDGAVANLLDDRGNYDPTGANVGKYPAAGNTRPVGQTGSGSGTDGAIKKGDVWFITAAGTVGTKTVQPGDIVRSMIDSDGLYDRTVDSNWSIIYASVPSLQRVLTSGATLTANNTIVLGANTLNIGNTTGTIEGTLNLKASTIGLTATTMTATVNGGTLTFPSGISDTISTLTDIKKTKAFSIAMAAAL